MGCTHYPFVIPLIREIVGPQVKVIDPAPAVARQVDRVLKNRGLLNPESTPVSVQYLTSGDPDKLAALLPLLIGEQGQVSGLYWDQNQLKINA
jgi:glutamate racemase